MTFYLKYRPQKLDELDLKDVRETLKKKFKSGNIPHAFLFSGPKGSGKTSAARIIAKIVNCEGGKGKNLPASGEPCNKCSQCKSITRGSNVDVVELDAASHRGIDDVRNLREAVKLSPANSKKKIYIIDESHMLTTEASNALLKILEEPPEHAIFILATTNPEKLLTTIRSRTTNINFKKASDAEIKRSLKRVVKGEKLKTENGVLEAIAQSSDGSFRDAAKLLEELSVERKTLKRDEVEEFLFQKSSFDSDKFFTHLSENETKAAFSLVQQAVDKGLMADDILAIIIKKLREVYLSKIGIGEKDLKQFNKKDLITLIELFSKAQKEIPSSVVEQLSIEIAIAKWCEQDSKAKKSDKIGIKKREKKLDNKKSENDSDRKANDSTKPGKKSTLSVTEDVWSKILLAVKPQNTSTEALLRAAKPVNYDGAILELGVFYKFHKERLETNQHRRLLEDVASEVLGNGVKVVCKLMNPPEKDEPLQNDKVKKNALLSEAEDEDIVKVAKDIFGS